MVRAMPLTISARPNTSGLHAVLQVQTKAFVRVVHPSPLKEVAPVGSELAMKSNRHMRGGGWIGDLLPK